MDKIWVVIQETITKLDEQDSFEYDLLSGWSDRILAENEKTRLIELGYRRIHVYPVRFCE